MRMSSTLLYAVFVLASVLTFSLAQPSCKERCGAEYYRGYMCQCDYDCLSYGECCKDYESKCTTKNSCKGRCGETFSRGRLCSCDPDCLKYNQCCSDYKSHCDAAEPAMNKGIGQPFSEGNSADDPTVSASYPPDDVINDQGDQIFPSDLTPESTSGYGSTAVLNRVPGEPTVKFSTEIVTQATTQADDKSSTLYMSSGEGSTESTDAGGFLTSAIPGATTVPHVSIQPSTSNIKLESLGKAPEGANLTEASSHEPDVTATSFRTTYAMQNPTVLQTTQATTDLTPSPESTTSKPDSDLSTSVAPAGPGTLTTLDSLRTHAPASTATAQQDSEGSTQEVTTARPVKVTSPVSTPKPQKPNTDKPSPTKPTGVKATAKPDSTRLDGAQNTPNPRDSQADDNDDTNLCSGRPVSAVTTLRNGTTVVFRGHYFWTLDSNSMPGPAQGITQVWGVPSPVDTVFTRCSCQGKTYIFKGPQYWRFENDVLDPGYPKVIETGFDGLRGHITAALSVPQHGNRRESVYFFKRGGTVQRYSYQFGTKPTCGNRVHYAIYAVHNRVARQAVSGLEAPINIQTSWRRFPSTITAAVSIPSNGEPDGYKYYVFSRSNSYRVRMDGERPAIAASNTNTSPQSKDVFKCLKKV